MKYICQLLDLFPVLPEFYLESHYLCLSVRVNFCLFLCQFLNIWSYVVVLDTLELRFIQGERNGSCFIHPVFLALVLKGAVFSRQYFQHLCQKSGSHSFLELYLDHVLQSIDLYDDFFCSIMLFLLLQLCKISWNQVW